MSDEILESSNHQLWAEKKWILCGLSGRALQERTSFAPKMKSSLPIELLRLTSFRSAVLYRNMSPNSELGTVCERTSFSFWCSDFFCSSCSSVLETNLETTVVYPSPSKEIHERSFYGFWPYQIDTVSNLFSAPDLSWHYVPLLLFLHWSDRSQRK